MAQCRFCQKTVPQGAARCPHCQATLQPVRRDLGPAVSPFEARLGQGAGARKKRGRRSRGSGGAPASRRALWGCLGLVIVALIALLLTTLLAPDLVRTALRGKPTPLPPTPRPTPTASPIPSPTPEWTVYEEAGRNYQVAFPPYWVVIDFSRATWERVYTFQSLAYSWVEKHLDAEQREQAVEAKAIWAFDPRQRGNLSVNCWLDPTLAGMTADEIRQSQGPALLDVPAAMGGKATGGMRSDLTELAGQSAAFFELLVQPDEDSKLEVPLVLQFYVLADEQQGYWIQLAIPETELSGTRAEIEALLDSFQLTALEDPGRD